MRDQDDLDLLLDSALSTYADGGRNSGLEQRILTRVASVRASAEFKSPNRRPWLPWPIALPIAASLLFGLMVLKTPRQQSGSLGHSQSPKHEPFHSAREERPVPDLSKSIRPATRTVSRTGRMQTHSVEGPDQRPKLAIFPTPRSLTPQEKGLVTVATRTPPSQRKSLLDATKAGDAPLDIAAIRIDPLEMPDQGKN
jgi:hypothetical protein